MITGAAGFLGTRLALQLLAAAAAVSVAGEDPRPLSRLTLLDQAPVAAGVAADDRVTVIGGDLIDLLAPAGGPARAAVAAADVVFHLAAAVSAECEADFDLGLRANVQATQALLEAARAAGTAPVVVFASSLAVFGDSPEQPLADYTRKGFLRGRTIRLMTISVRPGRPNAAMSGFLSGIIREPLAGQRAVCPVRPPWRWPLPPGRLTGCWRRPARARRPGAAARR